jgi:lambda family phage portal protein
MRPNLLHVFEQKRPGQNRGLSELTSALTEMRMFKKFNRTQLEKNVVAATYAASIESDLPNDIPAALGAGASSDGSATVDYIASYLEAVNAYSADGKSLHMNGAMIPILPPGTKLNLQNTGAVAPDHDAYVASILRYIASAYNLSYEQLSRDFTKTNYSSARASLGEAWKSLQTKKKMTADRLANFIFRLWLEEAINRNQIEALKRKRVPFFYDGMNADAYSRADWIGAGRGVIDPLKETQADALAIQTRLETREAIIARRSGRDWRAVAKQVKRENDLDTILGLPPVQPVSKQDKADEQNGNAQ